MEQDMKEQTEEQTLTDIPEEQEQQKKIILPPKQKKTSFSFVKQLERLPNELLNTIVLHCDLSLFISCLAEINCEESELILDKKLKKEVNYFSKLEFTSPLEPETLVLDVLYSFTTKRILEESIKGNFSKDLTLSAAHFLRSFYWNTERGWTIKRNFPLFFQKDKNLPFSIWKKSSTIVFVHTIWTCENIEVSYFKLLRTMARNFNGMDCKKLPVFALAQKANKIAFFIYNSRSNCLNEKFQLFNSTDADLDHSQSKEEKKYPIDFTWRNFVSYHPFIRESVSRRSVPNPALRIIGDELFQKENSEQELSELEFFQNIGVEFIRAPEDWSGIKTPVIWSQGQIIPGLCTYPEIPYYAAFWDILNKDQAPYLDHIFRNLSKFLPSESRRITVIPSGRGRNIGLRTDRYLATTASNITNTEFPAGSGLDIEQIPYLPDFILTDGIL